MDKIYSSKEVTVNVTCPHCEEEFEVERHAELTIYEPDIDVEVVV